MELPPKYRGLYKHWNRHTLPRSAQPHGITDDQSILGDLKSFVDERMQVFERKESGHSKPYSSDAILNTFRFCNIYRELDRQTIFYHELLKPLEDDFALWLLNILFCRSICNTDTVRSIGTVSFHNTEIEQAYLHLNAMKSPKYGTAYLFPISLIQKSEWNTRELFFCKYYPSVIPRVAQIVKRFEKISVSDALEKVLPIFGFNMKFLWTEVLIDVAYQYPEKIDLYKRFPIGPGSKPTMRRINHLQDPEMTNLGMIGLLDEELDLLTIDRQKIILSAENWEGIGCEFRKYSNLKNGKGRRRLFH